MARPASHNGIRTITGMTSGISGSAKSTSSAMPGSRNGNSAIETIPKPTPNMLATSSQLSVLG